jgi:hypothetical protein
MNNEGADRIERRARAIAAVRDHISGINLNRQPIQDEIDVPTQDRIHVPILPRHVPVAINAEQQILNAEMRRERLIAAVRNHVLNININYPICLAWALTVWKAQGMTIKGLVKFLLGDKEKQHGLTYVGMSRVEICEQLNIGPGCSLERLTTKISSGSRLIKRLVEDKRLDILYEACKQYYFSN